ncbi:hypothetical protein SAMN00120144_3055 [Hymenobacter roseosalivarius DSM 11622]|uniref:Lipocalin-like domain-containing protein n=1 Tax=Hymenobacter roseosalivarius DSM 11622 TaxID=645990 RepID=A0A1W1W4Z0_9BACT|nr:hypothetical protein [Hymenobacter roseosalivarius]SMC00675.1 hypothetical protein SAMN00120144_3055 [Hymenobacter roseosalivarius DSM 11622]
MKKMLLVLCLGGCLSSCAKQEETPSPAPPTPAVTLVGTWTGITVRDQEDYHDSTPDRDVTNNMPAGLFTLKFTAEGTLSATTPNGTQIGTYRLDQQVLTTTYNGRAHTSTVEELTLRRLVLKQVTTDAQSTFTTTYTYAR